MMLYPQGLYAVSYYTESGDKGFVGLFHGRPEDDHLATITREQFPHEIDEEGGEEVRLVFFDIHKVEKGVEDLPHPSEPIQSI